MAMGECESDSISPLDVIQSHLDDIVRALKCPACGRPFGAHPYKSGTCGHTLCSECGDLAINSLGKCPVKVPMCGMFVTPKELNLDRQVRDLVNTASKFKASLSTATSENIPTTPRRKRVCVTSLDSKKSKQRIFKSLRGLDAHIHTIPVGDTNDNDNGNDTNIDIPHVVVTPLHVSTRECISRSRSVHYALAYRLPIVDVSWVNASYKRGKWLPTRPYECARPSSGTREYIFEHCVFDIDIDASIGGTLAYDVRRWVVAGGGALKFPGKGADNGNGNSNIDVRMYVRIVPDLAKCSHNDNVDAWDPEVTRMCARYDIEPQLQDVPWISDCLISQACPPATSILETMAETYTIHDSEWMEDDDAE